MNTEEPAVTLSGLDAYAHDAASERVPSAARPIKALGEVALRVKNLDWMQSFYQEVVGLELLKRFPRSAFFRISEGVGGHTQVVALFDRSENEQSREVDSERTTLDHVAFTVLLDDFVAEKKRVEDLGVAVVTDEHEWVHWRSFYINDPEGNEVEWVCYDPAV